MAWWGWLIFAGGAAVFMTVFLVVNACQAVRNRVLVALAVLSFTIMLTSLIAAASFVPEGWSGIPLVVFTLWFILFCIAEVVFLIFFFRPTIEIRIFLNNLHRKIKTNPLKGWGGATFAEYAGLIGLLITVGIYRVFETDQGSYWWVAQIAAIVSVISTAAWTQRYVLEGPEKDDGSAMFGRLGRSRGAYFKKTFPTLLNGISAALTVLAICIPVESNNAARSTAIGGGWRVVFVLWILVFLIWLFIALVPKSRDVFLWPIWTRRGDIWNNRDNLWVYLYPIAITAFLSLIFISIWFFIPDTEWGNGWAVAFGIIPAVLYILSVIWKAIADGYDAEGASWLGFLFRDILLCAGGIFILIAQILTAMGMEETVKDGPFAFFYQFFLLNMILISLLNISFAAYEWSTKPPYQEIILEKGISYQDVDMQPLPQAPH